MILVTGGTGFVGSGIVRELARRGKPVRVMSREAERAARRFAGLDVQAVAGDVRDPEGLARAVEGAGTVIGCVQFPNSPIENPRRGLTFEEIDERGTVRLADTSPYGGSEMSELRRDPTTREWVIIATERAARPHSFRAPPRPRTTSREGCPFCPGRESETPPEVLVRPQNGPWRVRVVPNLYAALTPGGSTERRMVDGHFMAMDGVGAHEVVIETPDHEQPIGLMTKDEVFDILSVYQQRYLALKEDPSVRFIVIFKNHGPRAGTSLEHPHSQIVATPIAPLRVRRRFEIATEHYDARGRCLYCELVEWEQQAGRRVVMESDGFLVIHPYASRSPFETWIVPKAHLPCFASTKQEELLQLATILGTTLRKIYRALGDPDFNYIVHTAPVEDEDNPYFHWHVQIVPRLTTVAGFEMGSGIYINTALPEETARFIREFPDD